MSGWTEPVLRSSRDLHRSPDNDGEAVEILPVPAQFQNFVAVPAESAVVTPSHGETREKERAEQAVMGVAQAGYCVSLQLKMNRTPFGCLAHEPKRSMGTRTCYRFLRQRPLESSERASRSHCTGKPVRRGELPRVRSHGLLQMHALTHSTMFAETSKDKRCHGPVSAVRLVLLSSRLASQTLGCFHRHYTLAGLAKRGCGAT